jgi:Tol biopolymer transport system component
MTQTIAANAPKYVDFSPNKFTAKTPGPLQGKIYKKICEKPSGVKAETTKHLAGKSPDQAEKTQLFKDIDTLITQIMN